MAPLLGAAGRLRGTTLQAPRCWAVVAVATLAAAEGAIALRHADMARWAEHVRYIAAALTFCPVMALLGAKRPQDRAWQFVVAGLWITLAYPSWIALAIRPHEVLHLHPAQRLFLVMLLAVGAANALATRWWPSAALLLAGQVVLVADHLPGLPAWSILPLNRRLPLALALAAAGLWLWTVHWPPAGRRAHPLRRVWLDFRDHFGLLWSLRVAERFNAAARQYGWPVRLAYRGLAWETTGEPLPAQQRAMRTALENLLRRFVDGAWIDARLGAWGSGPAASASHTEITAPSPRGDG